MVPKYWKIVAILILPLLVVACKRSQPQLVEKRNIPVEFSNGDIVFRRGYGAASGAVLRANVRGSYSHVGVVMKSDGEWMVVHEVPYEGRSRDDDKIYVEPVGEFFNTIKAASGAVYRLLEGLDSLDQQIVCRYLSRQVSAQVPFDHDYDLDDTTRLYCSELVWRGYLEIGVDVSKGSRTKVTLPGFWGTHIMPADIEQNCDLTLLYRF